MIFIGFYDYFYNQTILDMKSRFFYLLLPLISIINIQAQEIDQEKLLKLTYDYTKDELKGKIPFDDYFKIVFKGIKPKSITKVYFFEIKNKVNKCSVETRKSIAPNEGMPLSSVARRFQDLKISANKEDKNSSQSIISPVDPERAYVMTIIKENSTTNHLTYNSFFDLVTKPASVIDQTQYFNDNIIPLRDNLDKCEIPINSFPRKFNAFIEKIAPIVAYYTNPSKLPNLTTIGIDQGIIPIIPNVANALKDKKLEDSAFKEVLPIFLNSENAKIQAFSLGIDDKVKKHNYDQRIVKLKNNIKTLEKVKEEIEALQLLQNDANIRFFYKNFVVSEMKTLKSNLQKLVTFNTVLKELVNTHLPEIILIHASTLGNDLKTSNSNSLVPDVGLVNAISQSSGGDLKYIGRPYLGLNWHFSGINRKQYLREIPNMKFRHRWSVAVGITIGKIDTDEYEDFYNGISPTIGMNYRLTRQIRTGVGTLLVREKNLNPILTDTKVALAPYLSLSFDIGLFQEASKLTKLIGF